MVMLAAIPVVVVVVVIMAVVVVVVIIVVVVMVVVMSMTVAVVMIIMFMVVIVMLMLMLIIYYHIKLRCSYPAFLSIGDFDPESIDAQTLNGFCEHFPVCSKIKQVLQQSYLRLYRKNIQNTVFSSNSHSSYLFSSAFTTRRFI